jgi:hypothetical protein
MTTKSKLTQKRQLRRKKNNNNNTYRLQSRGYTEKARPSWQFLSPHQYLTFKYSDFQSFSLATLVGTQQLYRMNSLFDPDKTGVGHQPYGYDQLTPLYLRYRVLRFKYKVTFATSSSDYYALVIPVNGSLQSAITNATTFNQAAESPRGRSTIISSATRSIIMTGNVSLNALNGVTRMEYLTDDRFQAANSTNPTEVIDLAIGWFNPSGGSITINFGVELQYETDLHDPILVAES